MIEAGPVTGKHENRGRFVAEPVRLGVDLIHGVPAAITWWPAASSRVAPSRRELHGDLFVMDTE
jgi:hypothetical protein